MIENLKIIEVLIIIEGYLVLLGTSGILVNYILVKISKEPLNKNISKEVMDTGFVVGKCENILILTFMLLDAYTALALIFAAKTIVRSEDMRKNSLFFLSGTMINVTYSVIVGFIVKAFIENIDAIIKIIGIML
ncbi:MAG: hypothetical protein Q7J10_03780 [Methanosarcinaceae archaeon]|nr:hypothetical protein [Methanosarcinaceae archaeon]